MSQESIKTTQLKSTNSPTNGQAPLYDDSTKSFTWTTISGVSSADIGSRVYTSSGVLIPSGVWTPLYFDTEEYDTNGIHDVGTPSRLTSHTTGKYLIMGQVRWDGNTTGIRYLEILKDNTSVVALVNDTPISSLVQTISTICYLEENSYVELEVFHNSSGNRIIDFNGNFAPYFMMQKIG